MYRQGPTYALYIDLQDHQPAQSNVVSAHRVRAVYYILCVCVWSASTLWCIDVYSGAPSRGMRLSTTLISQAAKLEPLWGKKSLLSWLMHAWEHFSELQLVIVILWVRT